MKRYRLTKSGVCDCMLPDDNGPWVKYEDAEQAHRDADESAKDAFRRGWEQCKGEAISLCDEGESEGFSAGQVGRDIASMDYKEPTND